jgi:molybdenum cofactor cytidylyltransferase
MLSSYQAGVAWLASDERYAMLTGVLLSLGDQPHVGPEVIRQVIESAAGSSEAIIIPSHNMRRGHPIYWPCRLWSPLLTLGSDDSLRTLLNKYADDIEYLNISTDVILQDMDTPEAYARLAAKL